MGDAQKPVENFILSQKINITAQILKVGHHGSSTSSQQKFLDAVSPEYAVVSVGKNNVYNLPKKSTLDRLAKMGLTVYRTDDNGTVIFDVSKTGVICRYPG